MNNCPDRPVDAAAPSWWTTAPQDGFSRRAAIEHRRMRGSKESHFVPFRLLQ